jgi:hypothetical protein
VYRLLHNVLVIVVSRAHANVFANLNLVTVISRMLVAELKSVEITPERVLKKYAQVRWLRARACVCVCVCVCVRVCARVCAFCARGPGGRRAQQARGAPQHNRCGCAPTTTTAPQAR